MENLLFFFFRIILALRPAQLHSAFLLGMVFLSVCKELGDSHARLDANDLALAEFGGVPGTGVCLLGIVLNGGREGERGFHIVPPLHYDCAGTHT